MKSTKFTQLLAGFASASLAASVALAEDEHDELIYLDEGEIDIAVVYHEDESALEFTIFAEHEGDEHGHEDEDEEHGHEEDEHHDEDEATEEEHDEDETHGDEDEHHDEEEGSEEEHDEGESHEDEHEHGEGIDPADVVIIAGADTRFELPASGEFNFLGEAGSVFYILPQDPTQGPAAPGIAMEYETGIFQNDEVTVWLSVVEGPGQVTMYTIDGFGTVDTVFMTSDGLSSDDSFTGVSESHQHFAWAFSEPGIYQLTFQTTGILAADGKPFTGDDAVITFQVGEGPSYLLEIDDFIEGWATTDGFGSVYTPSYPWMFSTVLGWFYAEGEGGQDMTIFPNALQQWLFTNPDIAPWYFNYENDEWIFVVEVPEAGSFYWSASSEAWLPL